MYKMNHCDGFFSCLTVTLVNTIYASIICSIGFTLGFVVVATLVHDKEPENVKDNSDSDSEEDEEDEESDSVKYCKKYWEEYNNLTNKDLSEEDISSIEKCLVIDTLPFYGGIHMRYNKEYNGYHYYNDRGANIPYKMLATVARKFVTTFDCKSLYINLNDELEKSKKVLEEVERRIKDPTEEEIKESVFANLKKTREIGLSKEKKDEYLIKGNFIKFKYMGKVSDLEVFKKKAQDEKVDIETKPKVIDFATFKNMFSLSKTDKDKDV
ncbi:MAG: hypothetical protein CMQ58_03860 [Gammaproteobacteria bacterium]|nr:hypothetical protein [Gammaproteobacteria bacterium]